MKVLILAGGYGTRISEESQFKPKPMIEIGGMPILWHIMKSYSHYGFNEFVILAGYKQYVIKEYFQNYFLHHSDVTFDFSSNQMTIHKQYAEPWKVTVLDTGLNTMTGGRIKRAKDYIGDETFMLTYGDGVSDVNLKKLLEFHQKGGRYCTLTAVSLASTKGVLDIEKGGVVSSFREKDTDEDGAIINGGFMVCEPEVLDFIAGDNQPFERKPLSDLASQGQLDAYLHKGFWHCMDTKRDRDELDDLWRQGRAPWKNWHD
ncbi:MAG: glucose-1-phosphate cytidylyltransferase [Candidatus Enteromonas sp.]|nr:glucose-1-phosphate cytidylyltransferase [Candidatus Enteromonas sp.]MDY6093698.1 glucose-1-phosphate cytidylyltransferase [Candidatus Enteromonas sp.]